MRNFPVVGRKAQAGAVLVAALIILVVLTLLGIAAMDTTGIEMKMANNAGDQQQAFESAELILNAVENDFIQKFTLNTEIDIATCSGSKCFNPTCSNGYCFFGINPKVPSTCRPGTATAVTNPWEVAASWASGSPKSIPLVLPNPAPVTVRYMVEFRCYVPKDLTTGLTTAPDSGFKVFRITAYVVGPGNKGRVMLQSTVKQL